MPLPSSSPPALLPVIVALGANLDHPADTLQHALAHLQRLAPNQFRSSSLWSSSPVDCPPHSPPFVNAVASFLPPFPLDLHPDPDPDPELFLEQLLAWESQAGRTRSSLRHAPRPLDLDLIAYGNVTRNSPRLTLPHPRAHLRRFVLQPLAEIHPDLILPGWNRSVAEYLADLPPDPRCHRLHPQAPVTRSPWALS